MKSKNAEDWKDLGKSYYDIADYEFGAGHIAEGQSYLQLAIGATISGIAGGNKVAMFNLGQIYGGEHALQLPILSGLTPQDQDAQAFLWTATAAMLGDQDAEQYLETSFNETIDNIDKTEGVSQELKDAISKLVDCLLTYGHIPLMQYDEFFIQLELAALQFAQDYPHDDVATSDSAAAASDTSTTVSIAVVSSTGLPGHHTHPQVTGSVVPAHAFYIS